MDDLSARLQLSGVSPRSSSRSLVPMRRLNTIEEAGGPAGPGGSGLRGNKKAPVPAPRMHSSHQADDAQDEQEGAGPALPPELPPPRGWAPEGSDPHGETAAPLLRGSSTGSQGDSDGHRGTK